MKKNLFLAALALVALASCSDNEFVGNDNSPDTPVANESAAISFGSTSKGITRADHVGADAANLLNKKFIVGGFKGNGTTMTTVFDNYTVEWDDNTAGTTTSNTSDWEYVGKTPAITSKLSLQTIKFWDYSTSQYDFAAFSTGDIANVNKEGTASSGTIVITPISAASTYGGPTYLIKGVAADLAKCYISDLVTAYKPADYQKEVQFVFRNLATKVRVALYETVPGYSVKDVKFYTNNTTTLATGASATTATLFAPNDGTTDVFYNKVNATVTFPTIGSANKAKSDYNKAHVTMAPLSGGTTDTKAFGTLNYGAREHYEAEGNYYLARTATNPTFAGTSSDNYYTTVLPNETGTILELRVDYTLLATDGSGEEIKIHGARAYVPQIYATWKSNYAYTYIFKISDNTNGWTSTTDTDPTGLFPITFDAIVVDAEEHTQSTITTVATPSITTYQKGHDHENDNVYKKATGDIYVQVMIPGTTTTDPYTLANNLASKGQLYKVSISDASTLTTEQKEDKLSKVSEAEVLDALSLNIAGNTTSPITGRNDFLLTAATSTVSGSSTFSTIPGVDGNDITVTQGTAAKLAATDLSAGYYAYVYDTDTYNGIYLAEQPTGWPTGYYTDNKLKTAASTFSAGTYYRMSSTIGSYVELAGAAPSDWNSSANVYYSDEACTTQITAGYTSLHKFVLSGSDAPADWTTTNNVYYKDTDCTDANQANETYAAGTYFKKVKCYRKYTVSNKIYGVKVIKVV